MNLFDLDIDRAMAEEVTEVVFEDGRIRIERIVSMGQTTPRGFVYDQNENEFVSVIRGEAELTLTQSGERIFLREGDSFMIEAGVHHIVSYTSSPCVWLCVFEKTE